MGKIEMPKKQWKWFAITVNVLLIAIISLVVSAVFILVVYRKYVIFAIRRPDIVEAGMKIEDEEEQEIQAKIKEIRGKSVQRILNPLVKN